MLYRNCNHSKTTFYKKISNPAVMVFGDGFIRDGERSGILSGVHDLSADPDGFRCFIWGYTSRPGLYPPSLLLITICNSIPSCVYLGELLLRLHSRVDSPQPPWSYRSTTRGRPRQVLTIPLCTQILLNPSNPRPILWIQWISDLSFT